MGLFSMFHPSKKEARAQWLPREVVECWCDNDMNGEAICHMRIEGGWSNGRLCDREVTFASFMDNLNWYANSPCIFFDDFCCHIMSVIWKKKWLHGDVEDRRENGGM